MRFDASPTGQTPPAPPYLQFRSILKEHDMADNERVYEDIGALKAMSAERTRQTTELFALVREISTNMATKSDVREISNRLQEHIQAEDDLKNRISELEGDRKLVKAAAIVALGAPPFFVACAELFRFLVGKT
jgi:hypothetical protein